MEKEQNTNGDYDFKRLEERLEEQVRLNNFLMHVIASRDNGVGESDFKENKKNETRFDKAMNGLGWTFIVEKFGTLVEAISGYIS
ncbi:hypothetical protein FVB32_05355 [Flagellimonas hymeniacidonis]|uniref:Uncharacterized protein n=1 Tax=Flagellimonas hymeniacidonis TaxID=2603628 RepID=A0A5C8V8L5_9FLAO|nr:hypothetical protein [Flagellimonas hymeniacidonis]TXN37716.1 hypothetical protein FVB32_05355 [Flagellimonas hymeniacidonis]